MISVHYLKHAQNNIKAYLDQLQLQSLLKVSAIGNDPDIFVWNEFRQLCLNKNCNIWKEFPQFKKSSEKEVFQKLI